MEYLIILLLSIVVMIQLFDRLSLNKKYIHSQKELNTLNEQLSNIDSKFKKLKYDINHIKTNDKVIFTQALSYTKNSRKESFSVQYEATVDAITKNKVKITAYDVSSEEYPSSFLETYPQNYKEVLVKLYISRWIDRDIVKVIYDEPFWRDQSIDDVIS